MYELTYERTFDAAHRLPGHPGKCQNLHGHTWRIRVKVNAEVLNEQGMVVDFGILKNVIDKMDHGLLNEVVPHPTAENIGYYLLDEFAGSIVGVNPHAVVVYVEVWEGPGSCVRIYNE